MKVLIVGLTENVGIRGVEQYCIHLVASLKKNKNLRITLLKGPWQSYYEHLSGDNVELKNVTCKNSKLRRHIYLMRYMYKLSSLYDLVHYANTLPLLIKNPVPTVMTIHDLAEYFVPEKYSTLQLWYRRIIVKRAAHRADKIITVSHFSKNTISDRLSVSSSKIEVIYNGVDHIYRVSKTSPLTRRLTNKPYILYFGVIERSKGIPELLAAFHILRTQYPDFELLFIGKEGNEMPLLMAHLNEHVRYLGFLPYEQVVEYLTSAACIVFASKYEGFGFPLLESFFYNNNIVAAKTSALGEIGNDFAILVDPNSPNEIAKGVASLLKAPRYFTEADRANIFSKYKWRNVGNATYNLYKELFPSRILDQVEQ